MSERAKLVVGNWKMNGSLVNNQALVSELLANVGQPSCEVVICPPAIYLAQFRDMLGEHSAIALGAQDVSQHENGAFTGDISASMLKDYGVRYAIVGHSERRQHQAETDVHVAIKVKRALSVGITPIVCVGETLQERENDMTNFIVKRQLAAVIHLNSQDIDKIVVAYEPVWAIGTGKTASPQQAQLVHGVLRSQLQAVSEKKGAEVRILYGGSMNANNAAELLAYPDIDGGLIGGASLKSVDFSRIVASAA